MAAREEDGAHERLGVPREAGWDQTHWPERDRMTELHWGGGSTTRRREGALF